MEPGPSRSLTTLAGTSASNKSVAQVWRRSQRRKPSPLPVALLGSGEGQGAGGELPTAAMNERRQPMPSSLVGVPGDSSGRSSDCAFRLSLWQRPAGMGRMGPFPWNSVGERATDASRSESARRTSPNLSAVARRPRSRDRRLDGSNFVIGLDAVDVVLLVLTLGVSIVTSQASGQMSCWRHALVAVLSDRHGLTRGAAGPSPAGLSGRESKSAPIRSLKSNVRKHPRDDPRP